MYGRGGDPDTEALQCSGSMAAEKFKAPTVCCIDRFLCKGFYDGACLCSEATGVQQIKNYKDSCCCSRRFCGDRVIVFLFMDSLKALQERTLLELQERSNVFVKLVVIFFL